MPSFSIDSYGRYDKSIHIRGPGDFLIMVNFDDVDKDGVEIQVRRMVDLLNRQWNTEDDPPSLRVLRGLGRQFREDNDHSRVAYLLARQARLDNIPDEILRQAYVDLGLAAAADEWPSNER